MGPGSTPASMARATETTSPNITRSRSWARGPSPSASTRSMLAHDLVDEVVHQAEPPVDLGVLEVVPELDERQDLTGDVTVLAPPCDLVVAQLGHAVGEGRHLGVLVALGLPPLGRDRAQIAPPP